MTNPTCVYCHKRFSAADKPVVVDLVVVDPVGVGTKIRGPVHQGPCLKDIAERTGVEYERLKREAEDVT